jgi:peptidoglycan/xylan/chitin deacetylase (PgdA/CDA1 family)
MSTVDTIERELGRWHRGGLTPRFWLRDDDATRPTPALDRLLGLIRASDVPVLLAVIPADATEALAETIRDEPLVTPAVHGYAHRRHTADGAPPMELGGERPVAEILAELRTGRARLRDLFGERLSGILVPPWNRLSRKVAARLHEIGFTALSTNSWHEDGSFLPQLNTHIDIVDWANGRRGRTVEWAMRELLRRLKQARKRGGAPLGILAHHLFHDEQAWATLEALIRYLKERNFAFEKADVLVEERLTSSIAAENLSSAVTALPASGRILPVEEREGARLTALLPLDGGSGPTGRRG